MYPKALILNPWITDFKLYDEWMHPLGLYFLISLLKHNHWDITCINCLDRSRDSKSKKYGTGTFSTVELEKPPLYKHIHRKYKRYGISEEDFTGKLAACPAPDIIFIGSGMTYWIKGVVATVEHVRKIFPDTPIVIGGISALLIPEIIKSCLPDVVVFSGTLPENISELQRVHPLLAALTDKGWQPSFIAAFALSKKLFHGPLLTSLGCPLRCSYCASSLLQKHFQRRPTAVIIDEIRYLTKQCNVTDIACYDDALLYKKNTHFLPLVQQIMQLGSIPRIHLPNGLHIRWLDSNVIDTMKLSGFHTLRFGYESGSVRHMLDTSAKVNRKELADKITLVKSSGFAPADMGVYVMAGLPGQTIADVMDETSFVSSLGIPVKPVFLSPVPHTQLFSRYAKRFPLLTTDPLSHNDTFFITQLPEWSYAAMEEVKSKVREMNREL